MSYVAVYINTETFTIAQDVAAEFMQGRRVRSFCGVDGYKYGTVLSSSYSAPNTTVILTSSSDDLTANLESVEYGIVGKGNTQSMPIHTHVGDEGTGGKVDFNDLRNNRNVTVNSLTLSGGQPITWNEDEMTIDIPTGIGPVQQVGYESFTKVANTTGSTIPNGTAVYPIGAVSGAPSVTLADVVNHEKISSVVRVTTMDIPNNTIGIVTDRGKIRDVDTSMWNLGDILWVSTSAGLLTNVEPRFPYYSIQVGGVTASDAVSGEIQVEMKGDPTDTIINFWNGVFRESIDFRVVSDGTTITGKLEPSDGHPDLTMMFSDGFTMLTATPAVSATLTPGTDANPQINYVYIPITTKTVTISTSAWPTGVEHIRIATIVLRTAATTQTDGALRNQNWNDHITGSNVYQGHLSHMTSAIREKIPATWKSGVEGSSTIDNASTPDDVWVATTSGVVQQMHDQTFGAFDTETGDHIHVVNNFTTPYTEVSNLNTQLSDALGNTLNNTSFSFVLWGTANKTGEASHLMMNLPVGSYAFISPSDAVSDALNYSVYDIPTIFNGVGFLIARFTYTYKNNEWVLFDTEDLRGKVPNLTAGSGGGGTGVTTFLGLTDTPSSYVGQANKIPSVNSGETLIEFVDIDHGDLTGLGGDDHTRYLPVSGGRSMLADLDMDEHSMKWNPVQTTDQTATGDTSTMQVDVNSFGFAAALRVAADGNWETADAISESTMPILALALETGIGSKSLLFRGFIRNDSWNWTPGGLVYGSTTTGGLTQTKPSLSGEIVQIVGFATHADRMYFNPNYDYVELV